MGLRRFAPFSFPPRAISDNEAKSASCCAETPFFLYAVDPYESKLSTARRHTKNLATLLRDFALVVIRLETENINVGKGEQRYVDNVIY